MKKKMQKSFWIKCIPILMLGLLFTAYVFLWYKQFSYFHYSGESYSLGNADLTSKAIGATEKEFALDPGYTQKIGRIVFWPTKYSDITVENNCADPMMITVSDYEGNTIPSLAEPVLIGAGTEYSFVADGRGSYVLTAYGMQKAAADQVQVKYDNHRYMASWKTCIYVVLGVIAAGSFLALLFSWIEKDQSRKYLPWTSFGAGAVLGVSAMAAGLAGVEDWCSTGLRFLSVFFCSLSVITAAEETRMKDAVTQKAKPFLDIFLSAGIALAVHFLFLSAKSHSVLWRFTGTLDSGQRIKGYLIVFVIFLISFFILEKRPSSDKWLRYWISLFQGRVAVCAVICIIVVLCETHNDWNLLSLLSFAVVLCGAKQFRKMRLPGIFWICYYGGICLVIAANHCVINIWDTAYSGDVYHTGTFYHSIYYVATDQPFAGGLTQMYGHFALFYKIPLLLFGNNMCTIGVTTAVFSGIAAMCLLLFLHRTLKEDFTRLLSGIVVFNCFIINILYLQTFPLRMLWPFGMLLYCSCFSAQKETKASVRAGGYFLCMFAVLWNLESGLVCAISWAVCMAVRNAKEPKLQKYLMCFLAELPMILLEVAVAYLIVKGYNMRLSEPADRIAELLDWKKEIATMAREEAGDTSNGKLFWGNAPWMGMEVVLMCCAAIWVYRLLFQNRKTTYAEMAPLFLTVFSAGIFIYWMGRPESYGVMAPYLGSILLIGYECLLSKKDRSKESIPYRRNLFAVAWFVMALGIAGYMGHTIEKLRYTKENLADKRIADYTAVKAYIAKFAEEVPEVTYGEAYGVAMLYMSAGRQLQSDGLGWGSGVIRLEENIRDQKWVLLNEDNYDAYPMLRFEKEIVCGSYSYRLYENTEAED